MHTMHHALLLLHLSDVNNMNAFIEEDSSLEGLSLWQLMKRTDGTIFNNAAQASGAIGN